MKKIVAIFFIAVIGIHFASCTVYAYHFFGSGKVASKSLAGTGSNEFMKFEVADGLEELTNGFVADFSELFTFSITEFCIHQYQTSIAFFANINHTTHSLYLTNHVLLI